MKRFRLYGTMTISISTIVEAASVEDALTMADGVPIQSFCHQCTKGRDDEWSTSGELDGTPENVTAEEEE